MVSIQYASVFNHATALSTSLLLGACQMSGKPEVENLSDIFGHKDRMTHMYMYVFECQNNPS